MFSEMIRAALEREIVGQEEAVNSVARGVTRLASHLMPSERSWAAYLLVGPPGTGRSHLVRSVSRILHGRDDVLTIHCRSVGHIDPWVDFLRRLEPLLAGPPGPPSPTPGAGGQNGSAAQAPRLALVQDLERAHKEFFPQLAYLLQSGQELFPDGRCLRLDGCMFFFTSGLCTDQILDQSRIGFPGTTREVTGNGRASLHRIVREEAEQAFGLELLGQFDDLLVFQRLDDERLSEVLDRYFARMGRWLGSRGIGCELRPAAKEHLLRVVGGPRPSGAHDLVRIHRDEVEFPIADLLVSGALGPGGSVELDHRPGDEHLHFSVAAPEGSRFDPASEVRSIPVT